ncbi:hypothetical protein IT575_12930 [bacterium]|nr:hypothetical protein [bacterium]
MLMSTGSFPRLRAACAACLLALAAALLLPWPARAASIVNASAAEAAYQRGLRAVDKEGLKKEFSAARAGFEEAILSFRDASKDSADFKVYREAEYLYDRLVDCCFTQQDWAGMKLYLDGLLVVSISERNLCQNQLAGALDSGVAVPTAGYLKDKLDESLRYSKIIEMKRTLGLILLDSGGEGETAQKAIAQYQALAGVLTAVISVEDGAYVIDFGQLTRALPRVDEIISAIEEIGGVDALWEKYPPSAGQT